MTTYFETRTRNNGATFTCLRDDAPEWVQKAVRDAHRGTSPSDWVYEECRAAFSEDLKDDDDVHTYADSRVDIYTKDIYQWAADMCLTDTFAEAEAEADECGAQDCDTLKRLSAIQYYAIRYIADLVYGACVAAKESEEA